MDSKHRGGHSELIAAAWLLLEGYEVFRNVSQFGFIDIVAIKDGKPIYLDVKTTQPRTDGTLAQSKLSPAQMALGVRTLHVLPNGNCVIEGQPFTPVPHRRERKPPPKAPCNQCGVPFVQLSRAHRFCSATCRLRNLGRVPDVSEERPPA